MEGVSLSVEIEDLTFNYLRHGQVLETPILENINLSIKKNEKFGILGPTGAGKSSLLYTLNGLIPRVMPAAVKGSIIVDGLDVSEQPVEVMAQHLGLVFSNPYLSLVHILVEDDVAFGPANLALPIPEIQKRVDYAIESCRLRGFEKRSTSDLSGGEMQAVAIAGIVAMLTPIMALDEPYTMLDPLGKDLVRQTLANTSATTQNTLIFTEAGSDIAFFAQSVDRIAVLYDGHIQAVGTPRKIFAETELMDKIGIKPPMVTRLFQDYKIPADQLPLTVAEGVDAIRRLNDAGRVEFKKPPSRVRSKLEGREDSLVTVKNLHHTFPGAGEGVKALQGIDLDIYPGEIIGIVGQNGSGKTTLSFHLVGLLKPTNKDATVMVDGRNAVKLKVKEVIKSINYAFQNPDAQLSQEFIGEEIAYGLKLMEIPEDQIDKKVDEVLGLFKLEDRKEEALMLSSLDTKRFVTIACLLALDPKILILDEPTNGLDHEGGLLVMNNARQLNKEGLTPIFITHNMELVGQYATRVIVMREGKIILNGPPEEIFQELELLQSTFLNPPQMIQMSQGLRDIGCPQGILTISDMNDVLNIKQI
jgi:energy-coupling factor transport system ATP-binding protein